MAHHLIPFGVMAKLPPTVQQAVVASGWQMDSAENLIALPGNQAAYFSGFNPPPRLPYQSGPHTRYDGDVTGSLAVVAAAAPSMPAPAFRAALVTVEQSMRNLIITGNYNPKLN